MKLYYIRHGEPVYQPDILTPLGQRQAEAVAKRVALYGADTIYASSSGRAKLTAQPTCELLKKEMKVLDQNTSGHFGVPELVLMEQAAMYFVWKFLEIAFQAKKGIVFCGSGNNGADGIAIARLLNEKGIYTEVCKVKDVMTQDMTEITLKSAKYNPIQYHQLSLA